jgi:membrane fusion protein, multidrug efflux system
MDALAKWDVTAATKAKTRLKFKQIALLVLAAAFVLGALGYGYYWWTFDRFFQNTDDAYVGGDVTPISPHISGFISQILVVDNQRVEAGQILIRLDDRDVRAAADHAEAILQQRIATLSSLRKKYELQQSTIQQASADVDAKLAQADFAKIDAERYRALAQTNDGSQQNAQRTSALDKQAGAAVVSARAGLAAAKQQLDVLSSDIAEADAAVAQAKADLETTRLNVSYAENCSPIDGYVGNRAAQVGAYVSQGTYLLTIVPAHGLWVDANFKEDQFVEMWRNTVPIRSAGILPFYLAITGQLMGHRTAPTSLSWELGMRSGRATRTDIDFISAPALR